MGADVGLALAAGLIAAVNPCGFALLPAYMSFLIVDGSTTRQAALSRALLLTSAMTAGFMAVFGVFGLLIAPFAGQIGKHLPIVTIIIGVVLAALGAWLLAGRELPAVVPKLGRAPTVIRSWWSMAIFGAAYAVASLGCTIGPFLAVVAASFRSGSTLSGIGLFIAYAAGMGLVIGALAVTLAAARSALLNRLRRALPYISRTAGGLMLLAGIYVAYYGWYSYRIFTGDLRHDPIIDTFGTIQTLVSDWLTAIGPWPVLAILLIAGAITFGVARARCPR
ncbi:cytochrome c biogenesis protein CcdA [Longispora sp. NPDC051575]|uniref:cytochrome c biogenesis CcdA family protein n=1 Tax=Longispora sp. NPDC051575 TaxID=3154943 RepID=UPI0034408D3E